MKCLSAWFPWRDSTSRNIEGYNIRKKGLSTHAIRYTLHRPTLVKQPARPVELCQIL